MSNSPAHTVNKIRPKVLFSKIENKYKDINTSFKVNIPPSSIGGMTLLESSVLVSLYKLFMPKELFEFGTYLGASALLLAENSEDDAHITTLDIDNSTSLSSSSSEANILRDGNENDAYLRHNFSSKGALYLNRAPQAVRNKVRQIYGDSRKLDVSAAGFSGGFDYIFIDGGHDYETIKADTQNALKMARKNSVILWHDYESQIHGDVTRYVNEYSTGRTLYHVEHTMLVFQLNGTYREIYDRL